ncbi:hypothetical protein E3E31_05315 [Thermococcus sp. M39]|uniref:hypothetical protein n=1 Tax=unclassified Thermococcus TaxID=2627626 RepID=UPI00143A08BA|nr:MULTISPECIES: hypothetical protein [unclassified Thermococcus]NJE07944.1 hypothetical protein [Thermococcus sp. M39]NJE13642.1 hypothetical protein [Thermococcus sp. LS2]
MMHKKVLVLPFIIMLILSLLPKSQAAEMRIVIFVSDNEADSILAESLANIIRADAVIKVPWGVYNPEYSAEALKYAPDKVIIIGGPTAVPIDYEKDFEEIEIPYERWYGKNRYETNLAVVQKLKEEFPEEFSQIEAVYIVHGRDVLSMLTQKWVDQLSYTAKYRSIWVFTGDGYEDLSLQVLDEILKASHGRPWVEIIVTSRFVQVAHKEIPKPLFDVNTDAITSFLRERGYKVSVGNYTRGTSFNVKYTGLAKPFVLETLKLADNKTQTAEKFLDGLDIPKAKKRLDMAKEQIAKAWKLYSLGNYQEAYLLAVAANRNADFVISISAKEWNNIIQGRPEIRLKKELLRLETKVKVLKELGIDVSDIEAEINELKTILNKPVISPDEYRDILFNKIPEIKKELREVFIEEKRNIKHTPVEYVSEREEKEKHPGRSRP